MRGIVIIFALCVLAGCSTGPTLEQLEAEALVTGDWSRVEQREARLARHKQRSGISCPPGTIGYCKAFMSDMECECVSQQSVYMMLNRRY
jgi:hypothetical protein